LCARRCCCSIMESDTLERTYSREQVRLGNLTPVARVRSHSVRSRDSIRLALARERSCEFGFSRVRCRVLTGLDGEGQIRAAHLSNDGDAEEAEKELSIEETVSPLHSVPSTSAPSLADGEPVERHVIRFEDGDPENPNNWRRVCIQSLSKTPC
jgi:hypothetical protein